MWALEMALVGSGLLGHFVLWVAIINRAHAEPLPRWIIGLSTLASFAALGMVPVVLVVDYWRTGWTTLPISALRLALLLYLAAAGAAALACGLARLRYRLRDGRGQALVSNHTFTVDVARNLGELPARRGMPSLYARLPGNELFRLHVHHKHITLPRLPERLKGLKIAQISDLHMSGRLTRPFFEEVMKVTNDLGADFITITGDLFDKQSCFEWIESTYARLTAPCGVYFIYGNHDQRVDTRKATRLLEEAGLVHLGGRWKLLTVHQTPLILAGNEVPWFLPPPNLGTCPASVDGKRPLRVLLSHSPDQFEWGRAHEIDLVLAGHNHGGQIRFPILGAVFAPSRHGTRYDMGTFQQGPTVMHVSRGTGTHSPVRFNCPPEITLLELIATEQS